MNYLDQFRARYPVYDDMSDQEVLDGLYRNHYSDLDRSDFDARMAAEVPVPAPPDDEGEIDAGTAFGLGVDILQQTGGSTLEGIGEATGWDWLRDQGAEIAENQKAEMAEATGIQRFREIGGVGDTAEFAVEQVSQQLPIMAPMFAGSAAGAMAAAPIPVPGARVAGAIVGGALASIPLIWGGLREEEKEEYGHVRDEGATFLWSLPQAALESVLGVMTFGLGKFGTPAMTKFLHGGGSVFTRAKKGAGLGLIEVPTEIGQQLLQRAALDKELTSEEAMLEYVDAAGAAFFAGGTFGAATNVAFGDRETLAEKRARTDDDKLRADLDTVLGDVSVEDLTDADVMNWAETARADDPLIDYILASGINDALKAQVIRRRLTEVFTGVLTEQKVQPEAQETLQIEGQEQLALPHPRDFREETVVAREGTENVSLLMNDMEVVEFAESVRDQHPLIDEILNSDIATNVKVRELRRALKSVISATEAEVVDVSKISTPRTDEAQDALEKLKDSEEVAVEVAAGDFSTEVGVGGIAPGQETTARRVDAGGTPVRAEDILERDRQEAAAREERLAATERKRQETQATAQAGMEAVAPSSTKTDAQFRAGETGAAAMRALIGEQASTLGPEGVATVEAGTANETSAMQRVQAARENINGLLQRLESKSKHGAEAARAFRERIEQRGISSDQALGMLRAAETFAEVAPDAANIDLKFLDTVIVKEGPAAGGRLPVGENGLDSIIRIALFHDTDRGRIPLTSERIRATGAHEAFHVVQDLYRDVDPGAANIINRAFGKRGEVKTRKDLPSGVQRLLKRAKFAEGQSVWDAISDVDEFGKPIEKPMDANELQAHAYEAYHLLKSQGKKVPGLGGAMSRYMLFNRRFFTKLGNALRGDGYRTLDDVFENVPTTARQTPDTLTTTGLSGEQASSLPSLDRLARRVTGVDTVQSGGRTERFGIENIPEYVRQRMFDGSRPVTDLLANVDVTEEQASSLARRISALEEELPSVDGYEEEVSPNYWNSIRLNKNFDISAEGESVSRLEPFEMTVGWNPTDPRLDIMFTIGDSFGQRRSHDPATQRYDTKVALTTFPYAGAMLSRAIRLSRPRYAYFSSDSKTGARSRIYSKVADIIAEKHGYETLEFAGVWGNSASHFIVHPDIKRIYELASDYLPSLLDRFGVAGAEEIRYIFKNHGKNILRDIKSEFIDGLSDPKNHNFSYIANELGKIFDEPIGFNPLIDTQDGTVLPLSLQNKIVNLFAKTDSDTNTLTNRIQLVRDRVIGDKASPDSEQASVLQRTMEDLDRRIPQADRVASANPRAPLRANSWTSILGGTGNGFNGTQGDIDRAWQEAINESDVDDDGNVGTTAREAVKTVGARPPSLADWNTAFRLPNRVRYWYEASAEAFERLTNFKTPEALSRFIDIVAGTSGGVEPYPNLMRAIGVAAEDAQGVPIRTDLRDTKSATKALAPENLDSLKFGNFAGTMQFINGLTAKAPLSTNDVQVASAFGFPGTALASKPILYEVLSRFYLKMRNIQNAGLKEGEQPYESWQIQALGWVMERGKKKEAKKEVSDDYGEALPRIISNMKAKGITLNRGRIDEAVLQDPRLPDLMSGTRQQYVAGRFATVETASEQTVEGKNAAETYEYLRTLDGAIPWVRDAKKKYIRIQRKAMEDMARRKAKQPAYLSKLFSTIVGRKVEVGRVDPRLFTGWGTFESVMSPNLRIPMFYRVQSSGDYRELTSQQRRAVLGLLGKALGQKAMAASQFKPTSGEADTYRLFVQTTDPVAFNPDIIEALEQDLGGYPLNIEEVPNGYIVDINVGGFDTQPTLAGVEAAVDKHLANENVKISPMAYASDYIEDSGYVDRDGNWVSVESYDSYINELLESYDDAERSGDRSGGVGKTNRGAVARVGRDLARHAEEAAKFAAERDASFRDWSNGVYDRLTQERRKEDAQARRAAQRRTAETFRAAQDLQKRFTTTGEQASALGRTNFRGGGRRAPDEIILKAAELYESGLSLRAVSKELADLGLVNPKTGRPYSAAGIQKLLVAVGSDSRTQSDAVPRRNIEFKKPFSLKGRRTKKINVDAYKEIRRLAEEGMGVHPISSELAKQPEKYRNSRGGSYSPGMVSRIINDELARDGDPQASALYNPIFAANTQPRGVREYLSTNRFLKPFALWTDSGRKEFVRQFVNGFDPIANLELRVNSGKLRDATRSAFKMAELSLQLTGRTEGMLMNGPPVFDPQTGEVRSDTSIGGIQDIFEPIGSGDKYLRFSDYAYARRAEELINDPNTKQDVRDNLEASFPAAQRQAALALGNPEFDSVIAKYKQFNDTLLQYLVDTGLISEAQRDAMSRTSMYVPFYKLADEDSKDLKNADVLGPHLRSGLSDPDAGLKTLTGKGGQIGDLYTNVIQNAQTFLGAGLRNEAMRRTIDLMGEAAIGAESRTKTRTTVTYKAGGDDKHYDIFAPDAQGNIDPDAAPLLAALSSFSRPKTEGIMRLMENIANVFRTGITLAPGFMLANFIRGDLAGWVSADGNIRPMVDSAIGLKNVLKNEQSTVELKEISGVGGYAFGGRPQEFSNKLKRRLRRDEDIVGVTMRLTDVIGNLFDRATFVGEATELATREAIYRRLRESGVSNMEAAYQGLALINYGRKGSQDPGAAWALGQILPLVPFLNARIQGLYRTGSALSGKEANAKATALKGLALMGATTALYALSSSDERWDEEPVERRLNYYIIYAGDKKILIPKPFEIGAIFSTLPEFLLDTIRGNTSLKDAQKAATLTFLNTFAFNPVPQAALPLLEVISNYDAFSGRALETPSVQRLMPGDRAYATTSATAMAAGDLTNISPIKMEHFVNGYLGSLGSLALAGIDSVLSLAGAVPKQPAGLFGNEPADAASFLLGLTRFVKESPDPANRWVGEFYELKREVDEIYNSMQDLRKNGEIEAAMELYENNRGKLRWRDSLSKMQRNMSELNRSIRSTKRSSDMSADEKRERLNRFVNMRNNLARQTERILQGV